MTQDERAVVIGCDHAAFSLKEKIKAFLLKNGLRVEDEGVFTEEAIDYPAVGRRVAEKVSSGVFRRGILLCGTGLGMSMVANKFPGVRAALCNDLFSAIMGRRHNDANVLVMGGRVVGETLAEAVVRAWLETPFDGGRHQQRIEQFDTLDILKGD